MSNFLKKLFPAPPNTKKAPGTLRQQIGALGEQEAVRYLKNQTSFKVIDCNWSNGKQEIDIICREGQILVFVEVRTRNASAKVPGFATINQKKRMHLRKAAYSYLKQLSPRPNTYRYDAIEIRMENQKVKALHHFKNIKVFS